MNTRNPDALYERGVDGQRSAHASSTCRSSGHDPAAISELMDLIEKALVASDALGLVFVGIDLCSALARLEAMAVPTHPAAAFDRR